MLQQIRKSKLAKGLAMLLAFNFVGEVTFPTIAFGLTSGPIDINQASFEPASTSEMVNLSTGDFTYNIPLMDVDGYPINIAYHGGVSMEQEASIVGTGWTMNVGAMNRMKRGLPDDFKGDEIVTEMNWRPRRSDGGSIGLSVELAGKQIGSNKDGTPLYGDRFLKPNMGNSVGVSFNNYTGFSLDFGLDGGMMIGKKGSFLNTGLGAGLESSSQNGMTISQSANIGLGNRLKLSLGIGLSMNTAEGLQNINMSAGLDYNDSRAGVGLRSSTSIPVSSITYTPSIGFEKDVKIRNFDFDIGREFMPIYPHLRGQFYSALTCLRSNTQIAKAYGYLHEDERQENEVYILDFNREGEVIPNKDIAYLPVTNHTFDVYNATAQGVGFSSRPFRSDVLTVSNARRVNTINGFGLSGEFGFTPAPPSPMFQAGLNINLSSGYVKTGAWTNNNEMDNEFVAKSEETGLYEKTYFKKLGNRSGASTAFYQMLKEDHPLRQIIDEAGGNHKGLKKFRSVIYSNPETDGEGIYSEQYFNSSNHYRQERDLRNTNIQYLTGEESNAYGSGLIANHALNDFNYSSGSFTATSLPRFGVASSEAKSHHLSEMTVLKGDGSQYVYGVPVVNHVTHEVTFNVSNEYPDALKATDAPTAVRPMVNLVSDCESGLINYQSAEEEGDYADNSINNRRGDNNLYVNKKIPASANSHLLSAYLSSNYIDRTGDGPTPDDFGGYTKFNYSKTDQPTKWRIPFEEDKAAFNEGLKSNTYDDMGSYVYGEREQWYLHSIESKNFVAVFEYGNRHDGYGVKDENGGRAAYNNSKRLVAIKLYTRKSLESGQSPIKTVHFEYDYLLCQGVPNNDGLPVSDEVGVSENQGGKLTLKGIYFTYGDSKRGKLHKYTFDYHENNPDYRLGQMDRWGNYLSNAGGSCDPDGALSNLEFPYASQNRTEADYNASAWSLSTIHLPSGSNIDVELEADDYSYVMEKEASKMFMVKGMSNNGVSPTDEIYDLIEDNNYLHVVLDDPILGSLEEANSIFKAEYIGDLKELYFKFLVSVSAENSPLPGAEEDRYEFVSGYGEIDFENIKVANEDGLEGFEIGLIPLKSVSIDDEDQEPEGLQKTSPISKASWQFLRKYLPTAINPIVGDIYRSQDGESGLLIDYTYNCSTLPVSPDVDAESTEMDEETKAEGELLRNIYQLGKSQVQNLLSLGGYNEMLKVMGYASRFKPNKSWVRLYQGQSNEKIGGGHRVKKITVSDNWSEVKPLENSSEYGTQYLYDKEEIDRIISSGVASYEPITSGGDENSYRHAIDYEIDVKMRVNDEEFQEKPLGESIFATSQVVYSKVEVKNVDYTGVDNNKTGSTVYEFYTARDFPSIVRNTNRASNTAVETKTGFLKALITGDSKNYLSMSQGYSIQLNDMHGKFKRKEVLAHPVGDEPAIIYSLHHKYYQDSDNSKKLRNELNVVNELGVVSSRFIGKDIDMVYDVHESRSYNSSFTTQFGLEITLVPPGAPLFVPSMWISMPTQDNRFRSSVTTKVVYSNGILEEIELQDKGRVKRTKNLLFDEKTGVPIVTMIEHESGMSEALKKPIYQYDYPAYWMYDGMGLASENWGAIFENIEDGTSKLTFPDYQNYFNPGDEIAVYDATLLGAPEFKGKFWILLDEETEGLTDDFYLIDQYGDKAHESELDYYESGRTYLYKVIRSGKRNLLGSTAASVTSLNYDENAYTSVFAHSQVLNSSAVEYTQEAFGYESTKSGKNGQSLPDQYKDLCGIAVRQKANPYLQGLRGNWNLLASYVFDGDRDQSTGRIREDGMLENYIAFWENTGTKWRLNSDAAVSERWIQAAIATIFDREGYNLESKDALGIYSSILLGYNKTLKVAEAVNARYYEVGFEGFEDHGYDVAEDCTRPHFRFDGGEVVSDPALAHSGRHALKLAAGEVVKSNSQRTSVITHAVTPHSAPYIVQQEELISGHHFMVDPEESKRYVATAWVREENPAADVTSFDGAEFGFQGFVPTDVLIRRSNIIDGWQRLEVEFSIPADASIGDLKAEAGLQLKNTGAHAVYFDDVRVQPFNSEMVSYVIDPVSMRLWATLDSRNFATFYQYDEEGSLIRIIQETERGKITVQENHAGIRIE